MSDNRVAIQMDDVITGSSLYSQLSRRVYNGLANSTNNCEDHLSSQWYSLDGNIVAPSYEDALIQSKLVLKLAAHSKYVLDNFEQLLPLYDGGRDSVELVDSGITSRWTPDQVLDLPVYFKRTVVDKLLAPWFKPMTNDELLDTFGSSRHFGWKLTEDRMTDTYLSSPNEPLISRAIWHYKRQQFAVVFRNYLIRDNDIRFDAQSQDGVDIVGAQRLHNLRQAVELMHNLPQLAASHIAEHRNAVLKLQADVHGSDEAVTHAVTSTGLIDMFERVKEDKRRVRAERAGRPDYTWITSEVIAQAQEAWETIPLPDAGTESSRTWGIEVETVRAHLTSRPRGWDAHSDGSLEADDYCDCGCDYCDSGDHGDCSSGDCGESSCLEFVSPILRHFNSQGLRHLCKGIPTEESNTTPGIHVHVGADDLTVADVGRLLFAYGIVSPLIEPIYFREERSYCKDTEAQTVRWWLRQTREYLHTRNQVPLPRHLVGSDGTDRYYDVNTHALSEHGTIEFRAMGPYYDYNHLVRWAWFVREMVNVSRLNLSQDVWLRCQTLDDVIQVLRTYGAESALVPTNTTDEY